MKKIIIIVFVIGIVSGLYGQESRKDSSILVNGKTYKPRDEGYTAAKKIYDQRNFEVSFMPGVGYTYYVPKGNDSTGNLSGFVVEYLIYAKEYQNQKPGPSHVRVYTKLNIQQSDKDEVSDLFYYAFGLSFSFEKNPNRIFMVPYFGLELAGLSQKQWGTTAAFTPTFGIHLVSKKNLFINTQAGYVYPVSKFDILQGWQITASINFALW